MTSERAAAYGRVMKALADLGPSKLHLAEQETLREAADSLLFAVEPAVDGAAFVAAADLVDRLVEADRLLAETGRQVMRDLTACGSPAVREAVPA